MNIGLKIKRLRIKMNLTQEELANRCELSKGFISQVERNLTSPSIATLMDILETLGTDLKNFFSEETNEKVVFKKDDFFERENSELGHTIKWIVPNAQKNEMEPILLAMKKNGRTNSYSPCECEFFGYVLSGSVDLIIGPQKYKIKKGESFYYNANEEHRIENNYDRDALILWASVPPGF
jgi:transcriptional regulator with XRE-family HTH domain